MTEIELLRKGAEAHRAGIGGGQQGGPICEPCMSIIWDALSRIPTARETETIKPLKGGIE